MSRGMFERRYAFRDWPNADVPQVAAGVYVIWNGDQFVYAGMSGRSIEGARGRKQYGLVTRLASHASGRLSGDQFCVYVANRLVVPDLQPEQLPRFATGELRLDQLARAYIRNYMTYSFVVVETSQEAHDLERRVRQGHVLAEKPLLNPL